MFCPKCGVQALEASQFCGGCGENLQTADIDVSPIAAERSNGVVWKLFATAAAVAVIFFVALFFNRVGPLLTAQRAIGNFSNEVTSRLQTSPFYAFELLFDNVADGTTIVSFDYDSMWERFRGDFIFMADAEQDAVLLDIDLHIDGVNLDFEFLMNRQYAMARSRLINNNFYGVTFATFREDLTPFGRELGWDRQTINAISDFVDSMVESFSVSEPNTEQIDPYIDVITAFIRNSEYSSSRDGGVTRIAFVFNEEDMIQLLRNLLEAFANDENVRNSFGTTGSDIFDELARGMFDELVRGMHEGIDEIKDELYGEVTLTLYVGRRNRMNRIEIGIDISYGRESLEVGIALDLGMHELDTWAFEITFNDVWSGSAETATAVWEISDANNRYVNTVTLSASDADDVVLTSNWNRSTGAFTLSYVNESHWGGHGSFRGNFMPDNSGGFRLAFDELGDLSIVIESLVTSNIEFPPSFINISEWNEMLLDDLDRAIDDLLGW